MLKGAKESEGQEREREIRRRKVSSNEHALRVIPHWRDLFSEPKKKRKKGKGGNNGYRGQFAAPFLPLPSPSSCPSRSSPYHLHLVSFPILPPSLRLYQTAASLSFKNFPSSTHHRVKAFVEKWMESRSTLTHKTSSLLRKLHSTSLGSTSQPLCSVNRPHSNCYPNCYSLNSRIFQRIPHLYTYLKINGILPER